jgi:hypothetical protein
MINQTTKQGMKNVSRTESERSFRVSVVNIDAISADQTTAMVRPQQGYNKAGDAIAVRILQVPGITVPYDVTSFIGILHGDPKNPIGVQLVPKMVRVPNIEHAIPSATYGQGGDRTSTPVSGRIPIQDDTIKQKINNRGEPMMDHTMVLKCPMPVDREYMGNNRVTTDELASFVDRKAAFISISEDEVRLIGNQANGMIINPQNGISINGNFNISSSMNSVRLGGAWVFNPMLQFQIPSTFTTPQPTMIWKPPGLDIVKGLSGLISGIKIG